MVDKIMTMYARRCHATWVIKQPSERSDHIVEHGHEARSRSSTD